jgi:hypothetical protein
VRCEPRCHEASDSMPAHRATSPIDELGGHPPIAVGPAGEFDPLIAGHPVTLAALDLVGEHPLTQRLLRHRGRRRSPRVERTRRAASRGNSGGYRGLTRRPKDPAVGSSTRGPPVGGPPRSAHSWAGDADGYCPLTTRIGERRRGHLFRSASCSARRATHHPSRATDFARKVTVPPHRERIPRPVT